MLQDAVFKLEAEAAKLKGDKGKVHGYANVLAQLGQCDRVFAGPDNKLELAKAHEAYDQLIKAVEVTRNRRPHAAAASLLPAAC